VLEEISEVALEIGVEDRGEPLANALARCSRSTCDVGLSKFWWLSKLPRHTSSDVNQKVLYYFTEM
jgi:hypothetical protein